MTDPVKTCANCGHIQAGGDYCEACGTRLPMEGLTPAMRPGEESAGPDAARTVPVPAVGAVAAAEDAGAAGPRAAEVVPPTPSGVAPQTGMAGAAPLSCPVPSKADNFWARFFDLSFEHFITPSIVKVLFVIAMVLIGLGMLAWVIVGFVSFGVYGILVLIGTLIVGFVSVLLARVFLEMVVVFFRIRDDTAELVCRKR
jgi:hypothetical protein